MASIAEYLDVLHNIDHGARISRDLHMYVETIQYSLSGNLVWSVHCPRYHLEATFEPMTLSMMDVFAPLAQHTYG